MSATSDDGYPTEVEFLRTINKVLAPPRLRLVAALNGFTPPPDRGFDYCEVGSGTGDSLVLFAAAHPTSRFLGLDINADHVAIAEAMARDGQVPNARFSDRDFEDIPTEEGGSFDFITAHGLLSWISPAKRAAFLAFAQRMLKPGGLLYVSYDALPGFAAVEPMRRLMLDGSVGAPHVSERARRGVAVAQRFADAGAEYFADNAMAGAMLEKMNRFGLQYIVHEYFGAHWNPFYVADVARDAAARDLQLVGQYPAHKSFVDLAVPAALRSLVEGGALSTGAPVGGSARILAEALTDYAINETFRQDVFIKSAAPPSADAIERYLDTTPFGTLVPASRLDREVRLRRATIPLQGPVLDALLPAIAERPLSASEIVQLPALAPHGIDAVRAALRALLFGEQVAPFAPGTPPLLRVPPRRLRVPLAYNRDLLQSTFPDPDTTTLFSPATGTDIAMPFSDALLLMAVTEAKPKNHGAWLDAACRAIGRPVRVGDRTIESPPELARALAQRIAGFTAERVPKLVQLGVLAEG